MSEELKMRMQKICDQKIQKKWNEVGISFYAFFENENKNPELLMEAAIWWIQTHKLDHFEKAVKIKAMVE